MDINSAYNVAEPTLISIGQTASGKLPQVRSGLRTFCYCRNMHPWR